MVRLRRLGVVIAAVAVVVTGLVAAQASAAGWGTVVSKWSGKCADLRDQEAPRNGAHVQQFKCKFVSNQMWAAIAQPNGSFQLISQHTGQCLAIDGGATFAGALAVVNDCVTGDPVQQWNRVRNPFSNAGGSSWLVNVNSGKCLELPGWNTDDGLLLAQSDCVGGWKQYWDVSF